VPSDKNEYSFDALIGKRPYFHAYQLGDPWLPSDEWYVAQTAALQLPADSTWVDVVRRRIFSLAEHPGAFLFPPVENMRDDLVPLIHLASYALNGMLGPVSIAGGWAPQCFLEDFTSEAEEVTTQGVALVGDYLNLSVPGGGGKWPAVVLSQVEPSKRSDALVALSALVDCFSVIEPLRETVDATLRVFRNLADDPELSDANSDRLEQLLSKHTGDDEVAFLPSFRGRVYWARAMSDRLDYLFNSLSDVSPAPLSLDGLIELSIAQVTDASTRIRLPLSLSEVLGQDRVFDIEKHLESEPKDSAAMSRAITHWLRELLKAGNWAGACAWIYYAYNFTKFILAQFDDAEPWPSFLDAEGFFADLWRTVKHPTPAAIRWKKDGQGLAELEQMIGLQSVKKEIAKLVAAEKIGSKRKLKLTSQSRHMLFLGNPGTGKTTVARIMGNILRDLNILPKGHVVEVSAAEMLGQYHGDTPQKVQAVVERALGGVLFIDEAYSITATEGGFGKEAVNELVRLMENLGGRFVVIAAGYRDEMQEFLKSNIGLAGRFTTTLDFEDYSDDELFEVFRKMAADRELQLNDGTEQQFKALLPRVRPKGFGNARESRNILDKAVDRQALRLASTEAISEEDAVLLLPEDLAEPTQTKQPGRSPMEELDSLVGLAPVKNQVKKFAALAKQDAELIKAGFSVPRSSKHMLFVGNPGTGKTTVARVMGEILADLGLLEKGHFVEVAAPDLIGEHLGETGPKTRKVVESALGGVLFIDEAYALTQGSKGGQNSFGLEAVAELLRLMDNNKESLVVIAAGYRNEMKEFLDSNAGLPRRFARTVEFPDYNNDELVEVFRLKAEKMGLTLADEVLDTVRATLPKRRPEGFGNAGVMQNLLEASIENLSLRLLDSADEVTLEDRRRLLPADIPGASAEVPVPTGASAVAQLNELIGLDEVKSEVKKLIAVVETEQARAAAGIKVEGQSRHMLFLGSPGTGKTTVARIMAGIFRDLGLLEKGHLVEVAAQDLIGEFLGSTPQKVEAKVKEALGGVLFIDEAYSLTQGSGSGNSYGLEAVATLLKLMEDHRDNLVVIAAGYHDEMDQFIRSNSGLESRFPIKLNFADYTDDELVQVFTNIATSSGYELTPGVLEAFRWSLPRQRPSHFSNARFARNKFEGAKDLHALRIAELGPDATPEQIRQLIPADIPGRAAEGPPSIAGDNGPNPIEDNTEPAQRTATDDDDAWVSGTHDGEEVRFKREWSGHRFTDEEIRKLLAGEEIQFETVSRRTGTPFQAKGSLGENDFGGFGFVPDFSKPGTTANQSQPTSADDDVWVSGTHNGKEVRFKREWSGHRFTDEEISKLLAGEEIQFETVSRRTGNPFQAKGSLGENDFGGFGFVLQKGGQQATSDEMRELVLKLYDYIVAHPIPGVELEKPKLKQLKFRWADNRELQISGNRHDLFPANSWDNKYITARKAGIKNLGKQATELLRDFDEFAPRFRAEVEDWISTNP